jgi:hypothetical protein
MKYFLLYIWQLPQHIFGLIIWAFLIAKNSIKEASKSSSGNTLILMKFTGSSFSLGGYIFLSASYSQKTLLHEQGHSLQSKYLGPLYLLSAGMPSAVFVNLWDKLFHKKWTPEKRDKWYYSRYPENWADKLGGVKSIPASPVVRRYA